MSHEFHSTTSSQRNSFQPIDVGRNYISRPKRTIAPTLYQKCKLPLLKHDIPISKKKQKKRYM